MANKPMGAGMPGQGGMGMPGQSGQGVPQGAPGVPQGGMPQVHQGLPPMNNMWAQQGQMNPILQSLGQQHPQNQALQHFLAGLGNPPPMQMPLPQSTPGPMMF